MRHYTIICNTCKGSYTSASRSSIKYCSTECQHRDPERAKKNPNYTTRGDFKAKLERLAPGVVLVGEYLGALNKTSFLCTCGAEFVNTPAKVLYSNRRCKECAYKRRSDNTTRQMKSTVLETDRKLQDCVEELTISLGRKPNYAEVLEKLGREKYGSLGAQLKRAGVYDLIDTGINSQELRVTEYLDNLGIEYQVHNRSIIKPYELDIYIPKIGVAIEVNDTRTHNSTVNSFSSRKPKSASYHFKKTKMCEERGIRLIHIFEKDLGNLDSVLHFLADKIVLRASELELVYCENLKHFIEEEHRQGSGSVGKGWSLQDNNGNILAAMTFCKVRNRSKGDYELHRFCVKKGYKIHGAASKLFNKRPEGVIVSYCDMTYNTGATYKALGFKLSHWSKPNYKWVSNRQWLSREQCQKHKLVALGFSSEKSESEIMTERGYVKVFDSGNTVWVFDK